MISRADRKAAIAVASGLAFGLAFGLVGTVHADPTEVTPPTCLTALRAADRVMTGPMLDTQIALTAGITAAVRQDAPQMRATGDQLTTAQADLNAAVHTYAKAASACRDRRTT